MDTSPPSWNAEAKTFSFFLRKAGREPVLCILATDALENAAQSGTEAHIRRAPADDRTSGRSKAERWAVRFQRLRTDRR